MLKLQNKILHEFLSNYNLQYFCNFRNFFEDIYIRKHKIINYFIFLYILQSKHQKYSDNKFTRTFK